MSEDSVTSAETLIRILPPELSNKIAAGEVVERPAAVVKELLDNAIDSGADKIQIIVKNSGKNLIQITDNGCGMSKEDIPLCFERHATSKISSVDDLYNIHTLGFRGEAMASIASVSQITMKTRRHEDVSGWEYELWGGELRTFTLAAVEPGTTVAVKNLFYNVPARRAFLKTEATELRHIIIAVQQAALANPGIAIDFYDGNEPIYKLPSGTLADRISGLFGKTYKASLIPVEEETSLINVYGYIIDPKMAKKTRGEQFLFVNGRPFMHRHLNYIIQSIYQDWIGRDQYPFYALFFRIEPSKVDVNVHPTKLEVKFDDEKSVAALTRSIVKRALNERFNVPALGMQDNEQPSNFGPEFQQIFGSGSHSFSGGRDSFRRMDAFPANKQNLFDQSGSNRERSSIPSDISSKLYNTPSEFKRDAHSDQPATSSRRNEHDRQRGFWQLHDQYIISQTHSGMFIVDQYAAHKRIIFEKALNSTDSGLPNTQQLLFPQTIDFSASDFELLREVLPTLKKIGFNIQLLSGNSAIVSGVPAELSHGDEKPIIESVLQQYQSYNGPVKLNPREKLAMAYASKAAIPRGKRLSQAEMESLIDQLFSCQNPFFDPLNKPTTYFLPLEEIHRHFR